MSDNGGKLNKRCGEIDFCRFVFALVIMLHHSRYVIGYDNSVFIGGSLGVEFFFLVSGYLMMAAVERANYRAAGCAGGNPDRIAALCSDLNNEHDRIGTQEQEERQSVNAAQVRAGAQGLTRGMERTRSLGTYTLRFLLHKIRAVLPEYLIAWVIGFVFVMIADGVSGLGIAKRFVKYFWELSFLKMSGLYTGGINGVTWYLSSMLLCMAILYPLCRRYPDMMQRIAAPLLAVCLLGYLCRTFSHPRDPGKFLHVMYKGNLRAMAELCLGITVYGLCRRLKQIEFTRIGQILISIAIAGIYTAELVYMYREKPSDYDYFFLFLMMLAVLLQFSRKGLLPGLFDNRVSTWLAKYSGALFFAHLYIAQHMNNLLPESMGNETRLVLYVAASLANGLVVMGLAALWRRYGGSVCRRVKALLIV